MMASTEQEDAIKRSIFLKEQRVLNLLEPYAVTVAESAKSHAG